MQVISPLEKYKFKVVDDFRGQLEKAITKNVHIWLKSGNRIQGKVEAVNEKALIACIKIDSKYTAFISIFEIAALSEVYQ